MSEKKQRKYKTWLADACKTFGLLVGATAVCFALRSIDASGSYASMIYVLCVLFIARSTHGYMYGVIASVVGVVCANCIFTYPYYVLIFTLEGYPLTFLVMLTVSLLTSAMTTGIMDRERLETIARQERTRSDLLRAVSHDLRSPLTSISGALSMLSADNDIDEATRAELIQNARDDAQWLIRMVENLLTVTRTAGESHFTKELEAVEEVVAETVSKFKNRYPHIRVQVRVPEELLLVPMDALLIEQVIANILENAVDHAQGLSCITLTVTRRGEWAAFEITDDGTGIAPEVLPYIFDGIHRVTDSNRNMGLGLSVCQSIIKTHGGTLTARNISGGGASFRFELPMEVEQ